MSGSLTFSEIRRPRGARVARGVGIAAAVVVSLLLVWGLVVGGLWTYAWVRLGGEDIPALREGGLAALGSDEGPRAPAGATTVLVALTDSVDPTVPRPPQLEAPLVLLQVGGPRERPAALLLPEDVAIAEDRSFADVQAEDGTDPLVRAVVDYTDVAVDHVVSLSIDALPQLVDAIGPVEVCRRDGCSNPVGDEVRTQLLRSEGEELALLVADLVRSVAGELDTRWAVTSPRQVRRVVDSVAEEIVTDASLRGTGLLQLASVLASPVRVEIDTLPVLTNPASGEVVTPPETFMVRLEHLRDGSPLTEAGGNTEQLEEELLAGIEVAVLNGAGVDGLASRVQVELESAGFFVVGTGNEPSFDRQRTVVAFEVEDEAGSFAAVRISEALGGVELEGIGQRPTFEGEEVDVLVRAGEDLS